MFHEGKACEQKSERKRESECDDLRGENFTQGTLQARTLQGENELGVVKE